MQEYEIKNMNLNINVDLINEMVIDYKAELRKLVKEFANDFENKLFNVLYESLDEKVTYDEIVNRHQFFNGSTFIIKKDVTIGLDIKKCVSDMVETGVVIVKDNSKKPEVK